MASKGWKALFLNDGVLDADLHDQEKLIRTGRDLGFNAVVVETMRDLTDFARRCSNGEVELIASIPCFSDHLDVAKFDWVRPRYRDGRPLEKVEWYEGISPLDDRRLDVLKDRITDLLESGVSAIALDFIRWPVHWEIEFRDLDDAPAPADYGADSKDFRLRKTLMSEKISEHVAMLTEHARLLKPEVWVGLFLVPAETEAQREVTGQDAFALGEIVDGFFLMSYHGILGRAPDWVCTFTKKLQSEVSTPVIPMVQLTADDTYSGPWDWGKPLRDSEGLAIVSLLKAQGVTDFVAFPGEALLDGAVKWNSSRGEMQL